MAHTRIALIGNAGCGKTTLAKRLGARAGLPHLELDQLVWRRNRRKVMRSPLVVRADLERFLARNPRRWVVEGVYERWVARALLPPPPRAQRGGVDDDDNDDDEDRVEDEDEDKGAEPTPPPLLVWLDVAPALCAARVAGRPLPRDGWDDDAARDARHAFVEARGTRARERATRMRMMIDRAHLVTTNTMAPVAVVERRTSATLSSRRATARVGDVHEDCASSQQRSRSVTPHGSSRGVGAELRGARRRRLAARP